MASELINLSEEARQIRLTLQGLPGAELVGSSIEFRGGVARSLVVAVRLSAPAAAALRLGKASQARNSPIAFQISNGLGDQVREPSTFVLPR